MILLGLHDFSILCKEEEKRYEKDKKVEEKNVFCKERDFGIKVGFEFGETPVPCDELELCYTLYLIINRQSIRVTFRH